VKYITTAFENLPFGNNWSLQLLNITVSKKSGTGYSCRQITLNTKDQLQKLLKEISDFYLGAEGKMAAYREVRKYDDTADALTIYTLSVTDALIATEYEALRRALVKPDVENDPFKYTSAYVLKGELQISDNSVPIVLVSIQNPVTTLKHKYSLTGGTFKELSEKVLSLKPSVDVIILGENIYFLTMNGEKLFNMERAYKTVCENKLETIIGQEIIFGVEDFKAKAKSGHNPRRFLSFSEQRLKKLKNRKFRLAIANSFSIPLDKSGEMFDATKEGAADKLVKLLCMKGMTDPFEKAAVEVDGARQWR